MSFHSPNLSSSYWLSAVITLGISASCGTKTNSPQYSHYEVAGTSKLTVLIDSAVADGGTVDNSLYMELSTKYDTFFVKPIDFELSFPKLKDSLTSVKVYYNDWHFEAHGAVLSGEYPAMYFPGQKATILIDTYPFEYPRAKQWLKQKKDRVYYEIRIPKDERSFETYMVRDQR